MPKEQKCKACGHARRQHSIIGCLDNGSCQYGCQVKFTDKAMFE